MSNDGVDYSVSPFPGDWAEAIACARAGTLRTWEGGDLAFRNGREVNRYRYRLGVTSRNSLKMLVVVSKVQLTTPYESYVQRHGGHIVESRTAIKKHTLYITVQPA